MLLYLVFSKYESLGAFEMYYVGEAKAEALDKFKFATDFVFDATLKTGKLYFVCFDTATEPGNYFKDKLSANDYTHADIKVITDNLNRAVGSSCLYTHVPFAASTKLTAKSVACEACSKEAVAVYKTAYGNLYCADCWDAYIHPMGSVTGSTDRADGLVEYVIGVANDTYSVNTFTEDEKGFISAVWQAKKPDLVLTSKEIKTIEKVCASKGFNLTLE